MIFLYGSWALLEQLAEAGVCTFWAMPLRTVFTVFRNIPFIRVLGILSFLCLCQK